MYYFVNEIQNGTSTTYAYENRETAESKYHDILHYASVSTVEKHGAILYDNNGVLIKSEVYTHRQTEEIVE